MRHAIPEEPVRQERTLTPPLCLDEPTEKIWMHNPPREKRTLTKHTKILYHFEHLKTYMARTGRYEESQSRGEGEPPPCEALNYPDARHHDCCKLKPGGSELPRQI
jgi:hypothetical protein